MNLTIPDVTAAQAASILVQINTPTGNPPVPTPTPTPVPPVVTAGVPKTITVKDDKGNDQVLKVVQYHTSTNPQRTEVPETVGKAIVCIPTDPKGVRYSIYEYGGPASPRMFALVTDWSQPIVPHFGDSTDKIDPNTTVVFWNQFQRGKQAGGASAVSCYTQ